MLNYPSLGECKPVMVDYLACLKRVRGNNDAECRLLAKAYLKCRMDKQLMAVDEFKNLGFHDEDEAKKEAAKSGEGGLSRLEQLKRENQELLRKRLEEEAKAG